jgi:hypothetical protein
MYVIKVVFVVWDAERQMRGGGFKGGNSGQTQKAQYGILSNAKSALIMQGGFVWAVKTATTKAQSPPAWTTRVRDSVVAGRLCAFVTANLFAGENGEGWHRFPLPATEGKTCPHHAA